MLVTDKVETIFEFKKPAGDSRNQLLSAPKRRLQYRKKKEKRYSLTTYNFILSQCLPSVDCRFHRNFFIMF